MAQECKLAHKCGASSVSTDSVVQILASRLCAIYLEFVVVVVVIVFVFPQQRK